MANESIQSIQQKVLEIHVSNEKHGPVKLAPQQQDQRYWERHYSENYLNGNGTIEYPFKYKSAAPVSAHYGVVDLWVLFRPSAGFHRRVYIKINDWLLELLPQGVMAQDGTITEFTDAPE